MVHNSVPAKQEDVHPSVRLIWMVASRQSSCIIYRMSECRFHMTRRMLTGWRASSDNHSRALHDSARACAEEGRNKSQRTLCNSTDVTTGHCTADQTWLATTPLHWYTVLCWINAPCTKTNTRVESGSPESLRILAVIRTPMVYSASPCLGLLSFSNLV